jgi:hypothetical protein
LDVNLQSVWHRIQVAARRVDRDPSEIQLVAVTKSQDVDGIQAAYDLGIRHFGENRVEDAEGKVERLPGDIVWHMIGHIQSRKARRVASVFDYVHSVDSLKLAQRLDRMCAEHTEPMPVLLQCNVSGEESKSGFAAERWEADRGQAAEVFAQIGKVVALPHLEVRGLMTMAPIVSHPDEARPVFVALSRLRDALAEAYPQVEWRDLSMGMTDDFEVAIEEGATLVRVGRAIFAPDEPPWCKV